MGQPAAVDDRPPHSIESRRLKRLTTHGALMSAAAAASLALARYLADGWSSILGAILLLTALGFAAVPLVERVVGSTRAGGWAMATVPALGLSAMALAQDGLHSDALFWMPFVPLVATLLIGRAGAVVFGAVCTIVVTWILVADLGNTNDGQAAVVMRFAALIGAIGFGAGLGFVYETLRRDAQAELGRKKDEFIAVVSHELRTPLTSIHGSLRLLSSGAAGELSDKGDRLTSLAVSNSRRLQHLIEDLLDVQKIELGQLDLDLDDVPLDVALRECVDDNKGYAREHDVRLVVSEPLPTLSVRADRPRLAQVMANLLSNAIKHSESSGAVTVGARPEGGRVVVSVADEGNGIPDEFRSRVFERFAQADGSSTRAVGGTGLGLAITKDLVALHGGEIWFESEQGRGTTFFIALPIAM